MATLNAVPPRQVKLTGGMLGERARINRVKTLHAQHRKLEESGRLNMLRRAAGEAVEAQGHIFWDSDIAKWIEGVGCSLGTWPDPELEKKADAVIDLYERAQESDGYLNTYFLVFEPDNKWSNLRDCHELYCAGHLMEAAVAYREGTGKGKLLKVMCRMADHIDAVFGPEPGKLRGYPGHEEIELALVRLYRATGTRRYLDLASFFVNERGSSPCYFIQEAEKRGKPMRSAALSYTQAHKPVREQEEAVGHAVRAVYPWDGKIVLTVSTEKALSTALHLRIPGWCAGYELRLNGQPLEAAVDKGWLTLRRQWKGENRVTLKLEMPVTRIVADPHIEGARGCVALQRGPMIYCAEQIDHEESVHSLAIPDEAPLTARYCPDLLGGCCVIEGEINAVGGKSEALYATTNKRSRKAAKLRAIPYPLWANRGNYPMTVWFLKDCPPQQQQEN